MYAVHVHVMHVHGCVRALIQHVCSEVVPGTLGYVAHKT